MKRRLDVRLSMVNMIWLLENWIWNKRCGIDHRQLEVRRSLN